MEPFDLRLWPGFNEAGGDDSSPALVEQIAIDTRRISCPLALFIALQGVTFDGHDFLSQAAQAGAKFAIVKKERALTSPIPELILLHVEDPLQAFQEIAKNYRQQFEYPVVGITGSYGKTMVKDVLEAILSSAKNVVASPESFNSQVGVPISLLTMAKENEVGLFEAAMSIKGEMTRLVDMIRPTAAILTHVGKKHLTTLGTLDITASELTKMLTWPQLDWVLLPNDPLLRPFLNSLPCTYHFWNEYKPNLPHAYLTNPEFSSHMPYRIDFPDGTTFQDEITWGYSYFLDLLNMVTKAAWLLGIPSQLIRDTLAQYTPDPMRTEIWRSPIGTTFINETYCSDPQSVDVALRYFDRSPKESRKIFAFGGLRTKNANTQMEYKRVGQALQKNPVDLLILFGEETPFKPLIEEVSRNNAKQKIASFQSYDATLGFLKTHVQHDDVVLIKGPKKESLEKLMEVFHDSVCNNVCLINLAVVAANIAAVRKLLPPKNRIMAMVKGLSYGTEAYRMAQHLSTCGVDILGVSYVDEGVALKRSGIKQCIFAIQSAPYEAAKAVKWDIEVGLSDKIGIETVAHEAAKQNKKIKVHLNVNTGMGRLGCRPEEALSLAQLITSFPSLILEGLFTHFACAEDPSQDAFTYEQVACFENCISELSANGIEVPWKHVANSPGALRFYLPQFNMVRIGLCIYGLYPSHACREKVELKLALALLTRIIGINHCQSGENISYGRNYTVKGEKQRIAVLPIGYFDGLHRHYSGKGYVIVRGKKAPMVGNICMDFMMVDVSEIPNAAIGDRVLIFGQDEYGNSLLPEELASWGNSIVNELVCTMGPRIQRVFIHEDI